MTTNDLLDRKPMLLVVDHDRATRFLARESLEQEGFQVEEARNGMQALAILSKARPDIILMDIDVPGMDGYELCTRLRDFPGGKDIPVVVMTGLDDIDSIQSAYAAGATDFVSKPVNWVVLGHRVRYMIQATMSAEELRKSESKLSNAQRIARLAWWEWDIATNKLKASSEFYRTLGVTEASFGGTYDAFIRCMHQEDRAKVCQSVDEALANGGEFNIDYRVVCPDNSERFVHQRAGVEVNDVGAPLRVSGIFQDITERIRAEEEIRQLVYYDTVTGLPNRKLFNERFNLVLDQARRYDRQSAILFLDLDRFKRINDTFGLSSGDELIRGIASRLLHNIRRIDSVARHPTDEQLPIVARLGGDEFMILITEVSTVHDVAKIAERLISSVRQPFTLHGHEIVTTASIGIALFPHDGREPDVLLKNADAAMYHAKDLGGDRYQFYSETMNKSTLDRLVLENSLRRGLDRGEFALFYQPQVEVRTGRLVGAEALIRWIHPEHGIIPPMNFIPLAEETGLIVPMGEWVLRAACLQTNAWRKEGLPPVRMSVNVSGRQFIEEGFVHALSKILLETEADPSLIELELTESIIMRDAEANTKGLNRLKEIGVRLSIDDFGTGYSSLSYLQRLPLDTLKIDRSFLAGVPEDSDQTAITKAIIALARSLNLKIIAEGVESSGQLAFLDEQSCDEAQGFFFSRPLPADEFHGLLLAGGFDTKT